MSAVQQDVIVVEERFIAVSEEAPTGIKQEEIPEDIAFLNIKSEPDEVSYVCVCVCVCYETYFTIVRKCHFVFWRQYFLPHETVALLGMNMFCCGGEVGDVGGWESLY